jgi:hypothetical protein
MNILYGQNLVDQLRSHSDKIKVRLWIAVPYIGGLVSVRRILGKNWIDNPNVSIRLLTDTNEFNNFNSETISLFHERGEIKHLAGLHAKIFILDDTCLLTSANLTNKAFTRRHEIGIHLHSQSANKAIRIFESWWKKAENVSIENLNKLIKGNRTSREEQDGSNLKAIWSLPHDPGRSAKNLEKKFLNYDSLLAQYKDFANKYKSIQRLWRSKPIFFETDCFLNYLFHDANGTPSNKYQEKAPRQMTAARQLAEVGKYAKLFKADIEKQAINRYINSSRTIRQFLKPARINSLTKSNILEVLDQLNGLSSYPWNKNTIMDSNSLPQLRHALDVLVNGKHPLAARMTECNKIRGLGSSSMNEILGFSYPDKYPLINKNSNSGLRFFGYQIKAY